MYNLRDLLNIYVRADMYQFVLQDGQGIMVLGTSAIGDIPAELWYFDTNSIAIDNGTTVIHPNAVPSMVSGRYLRMEIQADWNALSNKPSFFSGDYNDLTNKPTIPSGQVQSDWNAVSGLGQILNKPTIPTDTNQLTNGAGFLTTVPAQSWASITGKPTLGTASANNTGDFATSAQGSKADNAVQPATMTSALAGKMNVPTGTTLQYLRGDGTLATLPIIGSGTVTSVGITGSEFSIGSSPVTSSGNVTLALATSGVTAGTYGSVTVNSKGIVTAGKRQETYTGTTNASGVYTITYGSAYSATPNVQFQVNGGTNKTTILITSSTTTGCSFKVEVRADVLGLLPSYSNVNGATVDVLVTEK